MNVETKLAAIVLLAISMLAVAGTEKPEDISKIVSDGADRSAHAKLAVSEYYLATGQWPTNNDSADYQPPTDTPFDISVGAGGIVEIRYSAPEEIAGQTVTMSPTPGDRVVHWSCHSEDIPEKYLPARCR